MNSSLMSSKGFVPSWSNQFERANIIFEMQSSYVRIFNSIFTMYYS